MKFIYENKAALRTALACTEATGCYFKKNDNVSSSNVKSIFHSAPLRCVRALFLMKMVTAHGKDMR